MSQVMKCQDPECDQDIPVIDVKVISHSVVTYGWCDIDGQQEVTEQ